MILSLKTLSENIAFYTQRKGHLEAYLANLRTLTKTSEQTKIVNQEISLVETEIQNFTDLLNKLTATSEAPAASPQIK